MSCTIFSKKQDIDKNLQTLEQIRMKLPRIHKIIRLNKFSNSSNINEQDDRQETCKINI